MSAFDALKEHGPKLALLLMAAKQGGPSAQAALMEGIQQRKLIDQQQMRQSQMDAQAAQLHDAQMGNLNADNARADEALQMKKFQDVLAMIDQATKTQGEVATDPAQAENAILKQATVGAQAMGLPPDQFTGLVPNMAPVISGKQKKQAKEMYEQAEKTYGPETMANDSITIQTPMGPMKPSQLRQAFAPATDAQGDPAKPYVKPLPGSDVNVGSFEDFVIRKYGKAPTPEQVIQARKEYTAADNQPKAGDEPIAPDDVTGAASAILSGRMAPSQLSLVGGMGARGVKFKQAVVAEVNKQNPTFNWQESEANFQFGKNTGTQNTVRYLQSVQESLPRVLASAQKLANGNIRAVNALINTGKNFINDVDLKVFQTDVLLVADEVAKILQGGGTGNGTSDAKLRQASAILSTSDSPAAIAAALTEINTLLGFRERALTRGTFLEKPEPRGPAAPTGVPTYQDYLRSRQGPGPRR